MTEPSKPRKRLGPVAVLALSTLAGWALIAVCVGEKSLDRADKAASVVAMLLALGALTVAIVERRPSDQAGDTAGDQTAGGASAPRSFLKGPSVVAGLSTIAVGLVVVLLVGVFADGNDDEADAIGVEPATGATSPAATIVPSASPSDSNSAEPCGSQVQQAEGVPSAAASTEVVRHDGPLILSKGFYADLDSLCPDWDVTDVAGSKQDIGSDGRGIARSLTAGTQIALVDKSAESTFAMCSSNTDYVTGAIRYDDLRPGNRYCVLTDSGRRSLLTVKRVRRDRDRIAVHLDVRTWAEKRQSEEANYVPWILLGIVVLVLAGGGAKSVASKNEGDALEADR
ncbi:hypothetical protein ABZ807_13030 [Micromonospora sp. NPDC047548]|uniref:hypothetical protein n=1 Tax=Micromonospora sp. NPDC047548 TaxID=3155624 RepID=UPI0033E941B9